MCELNVRRKVYVFVGGREVEEINGLVELKGLY